MIYVFLGKEINIINNRVNELISKLKIDNVIKYDFSDISLNGIIDEACYVDLFNETKLIIVSNFSFKKVKENEEKRLIGYINNLGENVIILKCIDETLDNRKSVIKLLNEKCNVVECKKMDYKELHAYVTALFKSEKKNITYNQIKRILDLCEYNNDITFNEIDKLLLYKIGEDTISDEDIEAVISKSTDKELFTLTDYVLDKNIGKSLDSFKILLSKGIDSIIIVDSLGKTFRMLFQTKLLIDEMNAKTIAYKLGVKEYTITKLLPYINKYDNEEIMDILVKLSNVDYDIKINNYNKDKMLESFLISL